MAAITSDALRRSAVDEGSALRSERCGKMLYCCSGHCRQTFLSAPSVRANAEAVKRVETSPARKLRLMSIVVSLLCQSGKISSPGPSRHRPRERHKSPAARRTGRFLSKTCTERNRSVSRTMKASLLASLPALGTWGTLLCSTPGRRVAGGTRVLNCLLSRGFPLAIFDVVCRLTHPVSR